MGPGPLPNAVKVALLPGQRLKGFDVIVGLFAGNTLAVQVLTTEHPTELEQTTE